MTTSTQRDEPDVATSSDAADAADGVSVVVRQHVEAVLLTTDRALSTARIGMAIDAAAADIESAIEQLNEAYESAAHVMRVQRVAGGWRMQTTPDVADVLQQAQERRSQHKLSPAALETLSIIAYRQPVMRAEVEAIRGVACGEVLRGLMERRLLRIAGRAEELGRPMLYGTTRDFLRIFGLGSVDDLPEVEGLARRRTVSDNVAADSDVADAKDVSEPLAASSSDTGPSAVADTAAKDGENATSVDTQST